MPNRPTQAQIYQSAVDFKDALIARDQKASERIVKTYARAFSRMSGNIDSLVKRIEEARAAGRYVSPAWAFQLDRYLTLQRQISEEIGRISQEVESITISQQAAAVNQLASDAAKLATMAADSAGVSVSFATLPKSATESIAGFLADGSPLSKLTSRLPGQAAAAIADALTDGITMGWGAEKTARRMRDALGGNMNRALNIARTETMRAYREANYRTINQNRDILQGWVWVASFSRRTCASCIAMAGTVHPMDERMESHPRCLLPGTTIASTANARAVTKRWTTCEAVKIRTLSGHILTVTPNHPILSSNGWVQAHSLDKGSYIVSTSDGQRFFDLVNPNYDHVPAMVEEIWESFSRLPNVTRRLMPASAKNFHGDGEGSEIEIVLINGKLRSHRNATFSQPMVKKPLIIGDIGGLDLSSDSSANFFFFRNESDLSSFIGGSDISDILFSCPTCHHQSISTSLISSLNFPIKQKSMNARSGNTQSVGNGFFRHSLNIPLSSIFGNYASSMVGGSYAVLNESPINDSSVNTELLTQLLSGYPGLIQLDQVVNVERFTYSGHVYNLETESGWYVANGIITHNCRCSQAPLLRGQSVEFQKGEEWFATQPEDIQRAILGSNVATQAYRDGKLALTDFVGRQNSPEWGRPYYQISTKRALLKQGQFPGYNHPADVFSVEDLFGIRPPEPQKPFVMTDPLGGVRRK